MQITITVKGEPDSAPYTKRFQFQNAHDGAFIASCDRIKTMLGRNLRININETLLLLSALVVSSMRDGKTQERIKEDATNILTSEQVMIGVPEMLQKLDFEVDTDGKKLTVSINRPIRIDGRDSIKQDGGRACFW